MRKIKKLFAIMLILVLLPYIITVFINGESMEANNSDLLDEYCISVLAKEVSSDYEDEMLKVQAVIVRTSIYRELDSIVPEEITVSELDASWKRRLEKAWKETEGQVLMYGGALAFTPFHYLSNGITRSGAEVLKSEEYPYLVSKECKTDLESSQQIQTKMLDLTGVSVSSRDSAGYVVEVKIGDVVQNGEEFRNTYGLASSAFELQFFSDATSVVTRGVGHGLGLSQYSANEMAKEGKSYQEILQHFYEGTSLGEVAEVLWNTE